MAATLLNSRIWPAHEVSNGQPRDRPPDLLNRALFVYPTARMDSIVQRNMC